MKKLLVLVPILTMACCTRGFADTNNTDIYKEQFWYGGLISGYANVDWSSVVATDFSTIASNPASADGEGLIYGADVGYQINSHFAIEGEYIKLPTTAQTYFIPNVYNAPANVNSQLSFGAVIVKLIAPCLWPNLSIFADAGPAYQYRADTVQNIGTWAPTFGGGFMYRFAEHWQGELSFQYAPGTGKSIYNPMIDYIPELYMGTLKVDYIF